MIDKPLNMMSIYADVFVSGIDRNNIPVRSISHMKARETSSNEFSLSTRYDRSASVHVQ
jgi:hypothetical protein